jgi:hypothetical protein
MERSRRRRVDGGAVLLQPLAPSEIPGIPLSHVMIPSRV